MDDYPGMRRVSYSLKNETAVFIPICGKCKRFVKPDESVKVNGEGLVNTDNATCSKCGRTKMIFEGFF